MILRFKENLYINNNFKTIKMIYKNIFIAVILTIFISCSNTNEKESEKQTWEHKVLVEEIIHTNSYTYLLVSEDNDPYWIAVPQMEAQVNDVLYYNAGLEMVDFKSKELDRSFDKLLLVQVISDGESEVGNERTNVMHTQQTHIHSDTCVSHENAKDMGVITLTELFTYSSKYGGNKITISGNVVKVNPNIMGKNWIHIQDGINDYDLTITTLANVNVDEKATFEGVITLDKDIGSGYKFSVIMEDGVLK